MTLDIQEVHAISKNWTQSAMKKNIFPGIYVDLCKLLTKHGIKWKWENSFWRIINNEIIWINNPSFILV